MMRHRRAANTGGRSITIRIGTMKRKSRDKQDIDAVANKLVEKMLLRHEPHERATI